MICESQSASGERFMKDCFTSEPHDVDAQAGIGQQTTK
jgi:hypothetical protein